VSSSPRRSTSLTLDRAMLDEAKELGVNVSRAAEKGLAADLKEAREAKWKRENAGAIEDYNAFIEENGIPLSEFRKL